jgi:hypothetical protein
MTTQLPFTFFDCDIHYYEALDGRSPAISTRNTGNGRFSGLNWMADNAFLSAAESTGSSRTRRSSPWANPARSTSSRS